MVMQSQYSNVILKSKNILFVFFFSIGGKALAQYAKIPIWGSLPIDPRVANLTRNFQSVISGLPSSTFAEVFEDIVKNKIPNASTD